MSSPMQYHANATCPTVREAWSSEAPGTNEGGYKTTAPATVVGSAGYNRKA